MSSPEVMISRLDYLRDELRSVAKHWERNRPGSKTHFDSEYVDHLVDLSVDRQSFLADALVVAADEYGGFDDCTISIGPAEVEVEDYHVSGPFPHWFVVLTYPNGEFSAFRIEYRSYWGPGSYMSQMYDVVSDESDTYYIEDHNRFMDILFEIGRSGTSASMGGFFGRMDPHPTNVSWGRRSRGG